MLRDRSEDRRGTSVKRVVAIARRLDDRHNGGRSIPNVASNLEVKLIYCGAVTVKRDNSLVCDVVVEGSWADKAFVEGLEEGGFENV